MTVEARRVGDEAQVSVRDTGIGIAEEEKDRIFEAFQRGGRAARTSTEGTGLGLTLSKRIIDLHGGRLWMESELGVGSTFSFAIPLLPASAALAEPASDVEPAAGRRAIVEDDHRSASLLRVYLEDAGYAVAIARDGVEGLEQCRRLEPAAVILDVLLPRLNGWEVLAQLKSDPATSAIPVVIVSMLDEQGAGFALGAADYLVKPVDRAACSTRWRAASRRGAAARSWRSMTIPWIWTSSRRCSHRKGGRCCARAGAKRGCESSGARGRRSSCWTC